jgi:hypothetical protein
LLVRRYIIPLQVRQLAERLPVLSQHPMYSGASFLRTYADGDWNDNLLSLNQMPPMTDAFFGGPE